MRAGAICALIWGGVGLLCAFVAGVVAEVHIRRVKRMGRRYDDDELPALAAALTAGIFGPLIAIPAAGFLAYTPIWLAANIIDRRERRDVRRVADAARVAQLERDLLDQEEPSPSGLLTPNESRERHETSE